MERPTALQDFLDAASLAFDECAHDPQGRASVERIFARLATVQPVRTKIAQRLPVCDRHLDDALANATGRPVLDRLVERFRALEPQLEWRARKGDETAGAGFADGHANVMIVGPGGFENRDDLWFGVSLLAPRVRYPDHDHAPEETYLVLSDGEFMHGDSDWFSPGVGGSFYNPPGIRHAMRAGDRPLFAFWVLLPEQREH